MREKEFKEAEFDAKDETSFEDRHIGIKALLFTSCILFGAYYIHLKMNERLEKRKQRI